MWNVRGDFRFLAIASDWPLDEDRNGPDADAMATHSGRLPEVHADHPLKLGSMIMQDNENSVANSPKRVPWNKSKLIVTCSPIFGPELAGRF